MCSVTVSYLLNNHYPDSIGNLFLIIYHTSMCLIIMGWIHILVFSLFSFPLSSHKHTFIHTIQFVIVYSWIFLNTYHNLCRRRFEDTIVQISFWIAKIKYYITVKSWNTIFFQEISGKMIFRCNSEICISLLGDAMSKGPATTTVRIGCRGFVSQIQRFPLYMWYLLPQLTIDACLRPPASFCLCVCMDVDWCALMYVMCFEPVLEKKIY